MRRRTAGAKNPQEKTTSSTVVKSLHVLQSLTELNESNSDGASVSEIARHSGESASSVCKFLAAFQQKGIVEQDDVTERYRIGLYSLRLASAAMKRINVRDIALPYLRNLSELTGETVHLVVRDGLRVVYIDKVESNKTVRMHSQIGLGNPMYCTGVGKAILAYSPSTLVDEVVAEGLIPFTSKTMITKDQLLADLEQIRLRGFSIDDEEHEAEVRCAAAPLLNRMAEPVASISVAAPLFRMDDERLLEVGQAVKQTAREISMKLGAGLF